MIRVFILAALLAGCAVKPAPMCIFCELEMGGEIHTEKRHIPPVVEPVPAPVPAP